MDPILDDFFSSKLLLPVLPLAPSSSNVAKLSLSFFFRLVTDSTALVAHPATLRRLECCCIEVSLSLSLVAVALLLVRFLDRRDVGREGGLLPPPDSPRGEGLRFDAERGSLSSSEESGELLLLIGDLSLPDDRRERERGGPFGLYVSVGEVFLDMGMSIEREGNLN
jgi:hypothetical protein